MKNRTRNMSKKCEEALHNIYTKMAEKKVLNFTINQQKNPN